jgi:hypothetical protein
LVTSPGCIHLDGYRALQVVRARHLQYQGPGITTSDYNYWPYDPQSELSRIRRDHEFLRVLATAVSKEGLGNPIKDQELVSSVASQLTVDSGFTLSDMVDMLLTFHSVNIGSAPQLTLPVLESSSLTYYYQGSNYGNVEFPSEPQDRQAIDQFLGVGPTTDTMTGQQLPSPQTVDVSVLDGTGSSYQTREASTALGSLGFDVVGSGYSPPVGAESETVVTYSGPSDEGAAEEVADSLSGAVILNQGLTTDGAQVTVTTGTDFAVNSPSSSVGPAATSAGGTTSPAVALPTTTIPIAANTGNFSLPTSATQALQPWDPRSCTVTGGEGP